MALTTNIILGDSRETLKGYKINSINLIVTSPPYADSRTSTYGGIKPDRYVEWFMPIADEMHRVLKPSGTFILNIKERVVGGERHTYVLELIQELRRHGWLWTEEFIWHKRNSYPGKWPNRFRDSWERLLQFNKSRSFNMYQEAVMVPTGDWAKSRLKNLSETDQVRDPSKVGSGFGKRIANWVNRDMAIPRMCCTWRRNAATWSTAPHSPKPCRNGSSSSSRRKGIGCSIRFSGQARRQSLPNASIATRSASRCCPTITSVH